MFQATAVTHVDSRNKKHTSFNWYPPKHDVGPIVFVATVVASRRVFWTNIMSPVLHPSTEKLHVSTDVCGLGFGCIHAGDYGCHKTGTCDYTLRWKCQHAQTYFDIVAHKSHIFPRYANVETPTDAFAGLSWRGSSLLCQYKLHMNGTRYVTVNNYFLPDSYSEVYLDPDNAPRPTRLVHTADGRFRCSFQRKNLAFQPHQKVYFTYGTITQDGWIARIKRLDLSNYGIHSQVRLCNHQSLALTLPKSGDRHKTHFSLDSSHSMITTIFVCYFYYWLVC